MILRTLGIRRRIGTRSATTKRCGPFEKILKRSICADMYRTTDSVRSASMSNSQIRPSLRQTGMRKRPRGGKCARALAKTSDPLNSERRREGPGYRLMTRAPPWNKMPRQNHRAQPELPGIPAQMVDGYSALSPGTGRF